VRFITHKIYTIIYMTYKIVIPSYKREKEIQEKTLKLLKKYKISPSKIYIFVADPLEYLKYKNHIDKKLYNQIVIGERGIRNQRIFISKFFKENEKIVSFDDDIEQVITVGEKWSRPEVVDLDLLINYFFKECVNKKAYLWGIYPTPCTMWMANTVSCDLKFCIGCIHGYINRHDEELYPNMLSEGKEDYEQSILFYKKDLIILRFNNYSHISKFNAIGGLGTDRYDMNKTAQEYLYNTYPEFCNKKFKKDGTPEIQLKKNPYHFTSD